MPTTKTLRKPTQEEVFRRENLRTLIREDGGPGSLATKLGHTNPSFLSQLAGPTPTRNVSEKVARDIEQQLGLLYKWLDEPRTRIQYAQRKASVAKEVIVDDAEVDLVEKVKSPHPHTNTDGLDVTRLTACIEKILSKKMVAKPSSLAKMVVVLYGSNANIDQLDTMTDLMSEIMVEYYLPNGN
jgi:hypothetical protein